ncbi:MAG: hypothetical protein HYS17_08600 [Micavibrio aeruginosavorus]|uniref:FAD-binding domain-containing protein n=1 Tax=Micavibrio aeruginosavorus TaxID=349221 RepID=A0A7T5R136_9BACT|nr:MAG: hypothetical protein HYS17_08600 [Micavibrio aeruginosavorus]
MTDLVIVGGGPVGQWVAINAKKRNPALDIRIYERYQEYQRSHVLRLRHLAALLYAKHDGSPRESAFLRDVTGRSLSEIFYNAAGHIFIRTNDLEEALSSYAGDLGVETAYQRIGSPDEIMKAHPECRMFVAADGAHSRMREALLGSSSTREYPLQYVVEVKYQAEGRTGKLEFLGDNYFANKRIPHMIFEYVGREKEGITPVTLRVFMDRGTYDAIPEASFKKPLKLEYGVLPDSLNDSIQTYMDVRQLRAGEKAIPESVKVSKLTLSMYAARRFARMQDDRAWFLAGDAAMGVPYFRSLNAGFFIGSQLSYILSRKNWTERNKVRAYNAVRPLDVAWEFTTARSKDILLTAYNDFRTLSADVPWEFMTWDEKTDKALQLLAQNRQEPKP